MTGSLLTLAQAPRGFVCTSSPDTFRIEWRQRDAIGRWVSCGITLALGFALPVVLAARAGDAPGLWSAALLFSCATVAFTLQLIPLRRLFFLQFSSGRLITDSTRAAVPLSSLRDANVLQRSVVTHDKGSTAIQTWHELWLELESGAPVQVGSRMSSTDAVFLRQQLHFRAPHVACSVNDTSVDLSEPRRWMSIVGSMLTASLVVGFFSSLDSASARQSRIAHQSLALAVADRAVTELLGAPLSWGWTAHVDRPKPHAARFSSAVNGPNGTGTLQADGYFKNNEWCFAQVHVRTSNDVRWVHLPACTLTPSERAAVYYVPPYESGHH